MNVFVCSGAYLYSVFVFLMVRRGIQCYWLSLSVLPHAAAPPSNTSINTRSQMEILLSPRRQRFYSAAGRRAAEQLVLLAAQRSCCCFLSGFTFPSARVFRVPFDEKTKQDGRLTKEKSCGSLSHRHAGLPAPQTFNLSSCDPPAST